MLTTRGGLKFDLRYLAIPWMATIIRSSRKPPAKGRNRAKRKKTKRRNCPSGGIWLDRLLGGGATLVSHTLPLFSFA